jgi:hypothetical protein
MEILRNATDTYQRVALRAVHALAALVATIGCRELNFTHADLKQEESLHLRHTQERASSSATDIGFGLKPLRAVAESTTTQQCVSSWRRGASDVRLARHYTT